MRPPTAWTNPAEPLGSVRRIPVPLILAGALAGCSPEGPSPTVDEPVGSSRTPAPPWFRDVTEERGLTFRHVSGGNGARHLPEIMGGGVALFDADADGDLDAYCVQSGTSVPTFGADPEHPNRFFRQEEDRFRDATEEAGLGDPGYGMGAALGDLDNDGALDVYVANLGPDRFFRNRGPARFVDATDETGLKGNGWSSSAAAFDYDRDGFLDLFVTQYVQYDAEERCYNPAGRHDYCGPKSFPPVADLLLRNSDGRRLIDVSQAAGIHAPAAGLGVVCADFDRDGWQDVYVANDAYANQLWRNQGNGTFQDDALIYGAGLNLNGQPEAGMGVVTSDLDEDGALDIFITHLGEETNTFYRGSTAGAGFLDGTGPSGLGPPSMRFTGFGAAALDADHDGHLDLVVANGRVIIAAALAGAHPVAPWDELAEPNHLYRSRGDGTFELLGSPLASLSAWIEISRGLAYGDIDRDGDLDLLIGNIEGPARLLENQAPKEGSWVVVQCVDPRWKRAAVGARVELVTASRRLVRVVGGGDSYQSASPSELHFGLAPGEEPEHLEITWPDGQRERFAGPGREGRFEIVRGTGEVL